MAKGTKKKTFKKKEKRVVHTGIVHVQATFNNTIVTIADPEGNMVELKGPPWEVDARS